ncbi:MAG: 30S ribosome-binding factor RbfA [Actinomycetota bacterium]|nr:30S ribosome-binding factor RbfA [Euzebyaceae bacterium]MBA3622462.1 30S ribosome-binding factor RbfA [Euzebyales bacterium]MDQ3453559.1 30S ribosome-binding factor RbfA [Actinomycetota bacterium]
MSQQPSPRMRRINEAVKEVLATRLVDLKDPRLGFLTVTEVRTTPDLANADVYYTVLPDDDESRSATAEGLRSASSLLRRELGVHLRTRRVPDLHFTHDPVPAQGRRIETLLRGEQAQEGDAS